MSIKHKVKKIVPKGSIKFYHLGRAIMANLVYGFPSQPMRIIGITGTNGKTTSSFLVKSILKTAGRKVGMLTTVSFEIDGKSERNALNMTTVNPFLMQKYLRKMKQAGCQDVIVETTSHAIDQYRIWGIEYHVVAVTNVTHDHLDYHGTFKDYLATKQKLFALPHQISVVNADDEYFEAFWNYPARRKISYGLKAAKTDVTARKLLSETDSSLFTLITPEGQTVVKLPLPGEFNVYNTLTAAAIATGLGIKIETIKKGLEAAEPVPGRMEPVTVEKINTPYTIIIDYAHTPDALEKAMQSVKQAGKGRLIAVYGACGDRDKTKRPILGAIGGRLADIVIITDEEAYTESPKAIIEEVAAGVERGAAKDNPKVLNQNYFIINDRREAIAKAIDLAKLGDCILVTGMGDQSYKVVGTEHIPWSDRDVIRELIRARSK